jgi:hypothetical protein
MSLESDPSFLKYVNGIITAALAGLIGLVWRGQSDKINDIRDNVKELYGRDDKIKDLMNEKTAELKDYVRDQIDGLRRDLKL